MYSTDCLYEELQGVEKVLILAAHESASNGNLNVFEQLKSIIPMPDKKSIFHLHQVVSFLLFSYSLAGESWCNAKEEEDLEQTLLKACLLQPTESEASFRITPDVIEDPQVQAKQYRLEWEQRIRRLFDRLHHVANIRSQFTSYRFLSLSSSPSKTILFLGT